MSRKTIHAAVSAIDCRVYDGGVDIAKPLYQMTEPYDHYFSVSIDDKGIARLKGVTFTFSVGMQRDLAKILLNMGAKRAEWKHDGIEHALDLINASTRRR